MELLIDTNVILDMVLNRKDAELSAKLFKIIVSNKYHAYITASSVTDLFYIIRKETHNADATNKIMENIFRLVSVISVTDFDIQAAFALKWNDFEDCVQYTTALNNHIDYIITNNIKHFQNGTIPALTPYDFLLKTWESYQIIKPLQV